MMFKLDKMHLKQQQATFLKKKKKKIKKTENLQKPQ